MLRPGILGMRGFMAIRLRTCMRSSTPLLSCTPPSCRPPVRHPPLMILLRLYPKRSTQNSTVLPSSPHPPRHPCFNHGRPSSPLVAFAGLPCSVHLPCPPVLSSRAPTAYPAHYPHVGWHNRPNQLQNIDGQLVLTSALLAPFRPPLFSCISISPPSRCSAPSPPRTKRPKPCSLADLLCQPENGGADLSAFPARPSYGHYPHHSLREPPQ